jgi:hypothetical protein
VYGQALRSRATKSVTSRSPSANSIAGQETAVQPKLGASTAILRARLARGLMLTLNRYIPGPWLLRHRLPKAAGAAAVRRLAKRVAPELPAALSKSGPRANRFVRRLISCGYGCYRDPDTHIGRVPPVREPPRAAARLVG